MSVMKSPVKLLMAAFAFGAVASSADMAFATPPGGHHDSGCKSNCTPTPPPPPPQPPQGDINNTANADADARARAEANALALANAQGGQGGQGGHGGQGGQGGQGYGGQGGSANSGGNIFAPTTNYEGSAPGTEVVITTECGWGIGGSLVGGSLSIGGNGGDCTKRSQAIRGLGAARDLGERGMFVEQYIQVSPELGEYRSNAATNLTTCGADRQPVSSIFVGQANMSEALCRPNVAQAGAGIENNVNVQVTGLPAAVRTQQNILPPVSDAPTTCEAATTRQRTASAAFDRAHDAWIADGSKQTGPRHQAYGSALMELNVSAAYQITLCGGPRGS